MNKLAYTMFIAFCASVATLIIVATLAPNTEMRAREGLYSLDEIAQHASVDSCWMAIEGRVYDISDYLPRHPTPASVLLPWCGREATEGMRTKGYGRNHSPAAWALLDDYAIGAMAQQ